MIEQPEPGGNIAGTRKGRRRPCISSPIVQGLILVFAANGAPVLATRIFGAWGAAPLDFGALWRDGEPLFGKSKTIRGVLASFVAASIIALLLGIDWRIGALAGAAARWPAICCRASSSAA